MHFATTATLMLRSMGIPARYCVRLCGGHGGGGVGGRTGLQRHAWVEVYLGGYGWQPVEVTPGYDGTFAWEREPEETPEPSETQTAEPTPAPTHSQAPRPTQNVEVPETEERESLSPWLWLLAIPAVLALACGGTGAPPPSGRPEQSPEIQPGRSQPGGD